MPSKVSQTQKGTCCMTALVWGPQRSLIHRDRQKDDGCQGQGEGELVFNWYRFQPPQEDEKVLEMDDGGG